MRISHKMKEAIIGGSMVRRMFEEGVRLKKTYGPENVFDYSLGNPDLPPPAGFEAAAKRILLNAEPGAHGYMNNAGWLEVREKISAYLDKTLCQGLTKKLGPENALMTVGAAGAMNVVLKAVLNPGSSVIVLAPYFMEYNFYVGNHGGEVKVAQTDLAFRPNIDELAARIDEKTVAVIINSPNNPTGVIYSAEELAAIGDALNRATKKAGGPILLISDEPYRKLAFNGKPVPSVFKAYPYSVVVSSFSKDLSLAGERIGFAAINPEMPNADKLMEAMVLANRVLGFVNAPSLMQKTVVEILDESVDLDIYRGRQELMVTELVKLGYELVKPAGTFYLFPKSPLADDLAFIDILREKLILAVPGTGFGRSGYFRLSLCLSEEMIKKSIPGFAEAISQTVLKK
jgi:aspartate aminotransferase